MYKWWGWGEVDFSEMLQIDPFVLLQEGIISSKLARNDIDQSLLLNYKQFMEICLVYVAS